MLSTLYTNKTEAKFLKIVKTLNLRGYKLIKTEDNFFIWQKISSRSPHKLVGDYIRLTLISTGWYENTLFYWDLELSFKPFNYNHNHKENAHLKSEKFKFNEEDKFFNYFLNMIDKIKLKGG